MANIVPRVNILGVEITPGSLDLAVRQMASWIVT